jgi:hypothetical protein
VTGRIKSIVKFIDILDNRTRNLPACSIVPQYTLGVRIFSKFRYYIRPPYGSCTSCSYRCKDAYFDIGL